MRGTVDGLSNPHTMLDLLPALYAEDSLASRLIEALDGILAPVVLALDNLGDYFDPRLTPADFLTWLGGWVAVGDIRTESACVRRQLVAQAVELHSRRGTRRGIGELIMVLAGAVVQIEDSGGVIASTETATPPPGSPTPELVLRVGAEVDIESIEPAIAMALPVQIPYRIEVFE